MRVSQPTVGLPPLTHSAHPADHPCPLLRMQAAAVAALSAAALAVAPAAQAAQEAMMVAEVSPACGPQMCCQQLFVVV